MSYKRYMVFAWTEYDNVPPFHCIEGSFDDLDEAKKFAESLIDIDDPDGGSCVFDRVEGRVEV